MRLLGAKTNTILIFTMCLLSFFKILEGKPKRIVSSSNEHDDMSIARRYTWDEMKKHTMNFSTVIGYGGFSTVYLAQFQDSTMAAIKIHCQTDLLNRAFKQELDILLHLHNDNIVNLLGYCDDPDEGFLVLEYAPNGTLYEKLHGRGRMLPWKRRMAIAYQLAQAIEYLHEKCALHIVHGDIKSSNVLLDERMNCKLCDFGSAKMGFSSTIIPPSSNKMRMLGSPGYTDPHYFRTGLASKKNDVYSFGVIVLELITGIEAFNEDNGERLTMRLKPTVRDFDKVVEMVDPLLDGGFDLEEAKLMTSLASTCLCDSPTLRPSASDIVTTMARGIPSISFRGKA